MPLLAVGSGAFIVPDRLARISEIRRPKNAAVANAVAPAIAQVSGEVDQVFSGVTRLKAMAQVEAIACSRAVAAGAAVGSVVLVDMEDLPRAYLPGGALRLPAWVVGAIATG